MGVFRQLGDPVGVGVCLCQHHGAAYNEFVPPAANVALTAHYSTFGNGSTITSVQITITERCCVAVNAAITSNYTPLANAFEIERPLATIRTTQEDEIISNGLSLTHHAAWEVLDPGIYTYFLVNRSGSSLYILAAWLKAIASDCEG